MHGDLRWDNCLAFAPAGRRRRTRVLLVDWEFAGPGRPAYDVGTVLAEYLRSWVGSIPILEPANPVDSPAQAARPLQRMRPAMQAFWAAYAAASPERAGAAARDGARGRPAAAVRRRAGTGPRRGRRRTS